MISAQCHCLFFSILHFQFTDSISKERSSVFVSFAYHVESCMRRSAVANSVMGMHTSRIPLFARAGFRKSLQMHLINFVLFS